MTERKSQALAHETRILRQPGAGVRADPSVVIPLSEHNNLLRAAGLDSGKHGLSDLIRLLRELSSMHQAIVDSDYRISKNELRDISHRISRIKESS